MQRSTNTKSLRTQIGVIPARYASTRFPGKPLQMILGKPMIVRTYQQAMKVRPIESPNVASWTND